MTDDKAEREPLEAPRAEELTPDQMNEVAGGVPLPPQIKGPGGSTHIPGNPV